MSTEKKDNLRTADAILGRLAHYYGVRTDTDLAKCINKPQTTISSWRTRDSVPQKVLIEVAEKEDLSLDWVITGRGQPERTDEVRRLTRNPSRTDTGPVIVPPGGDPGLVMIPRYDVKVSAGHGAIAEVESKYGTLGFQRAWIEKRGYQADMLGVFEITGDSMYPKLSDGDLGVFNRAQTHVKSGKVYVIRVEEELMVKYLHYLPGGILQASSENDAYKPFTIDTKIENGVEIIGRLVAHNHEWL